MKYKIRKIENNFPIMRDCKNLNESDENIDFCLRNIDFCLKIVRETLLMISNTKASNNNDYDNLQTDKLIAQINNLLERKIK